MERRFEPVDLVAAVGVFATIMGACTFFLAANGSLSSSVRETFSTPLSAVTVAMQWLQPALGESIVERQVLQRNAVHDMQQAALQLVSAMEVAEEFGLAGHGYLDRIVARAQTAAEEQAGHIQFVMGRMIVNFTAQGVRNDQLSASALDGPYNGRWLEITQATHKRLRSEFEQHSQSNLGEAIVSASVAQIALQGQSQERLGTAIARIAYVQEVYREASRAADVQSAAVMTAAFRTQALDGRLAELARAEPVGHPVVPYIPAHTIPDITMSVLVAGSAAAIAIFLMALTWSPRKAELSLAESNTELSSPYRKTG